MNIAKGEKYVESLLDEELVGHLDDWGVHAFKRTMDYKVQSDAHLQIDHLMQKSLTHCCNTTNDVADTVLLTSTDHLRNAVRQQLINSLIRDKVLQQTKSTSAYSSNQSNWMLLGYHSFSSKFDPKKIFTLLTKICTMLDPILPSAEDMYRVLNEQISKQFSKKIQGWHLEDIVVGNHARDKHYVYKPESGMDSFRTSNDYKGDSIIAHMTPATNSLMNRLYYVLTTDSGDKRHIFKITMPVTFLMRSKGVNLAQEAEVLLFRLRVVDPQDEFASCLKHTRSYTFVPQNKSLQSLTLKGWMKYYCDVDKEPYRAGIFAAFAYLESHAEKDRLTVLRKMDYFASQPGAFLEDESDNKMFGKAFRFMTNMLIASFMLSKHPVKSVTFVSSDTLQDVYH